MEQETISNQVYKTISNQVYKTCYYTTYYPGFRGSHSRDAKRLEDSIADKVMFILDPYKFSRETAQFMQIYQSREVGQSYVTSVGTTLFAIAHALLLMMKIKPQVILCNGPGTCIPLCAIAFFFKVLGIRWSSIFYMESIAQVKRLSLSGIILYKLHTADQLFVQWPQLQRKYPRAEYVGCLM